MKYTPVQEKMLTVIRERKDWMTVKEIAQAIGRDEPLPTDYGHLKIIAQAGDIWQEKRVRGAVQEYYVYKAVTT